MILPTWFDHLGESFSKYKEVHFKRFWSPVKTSCPAAEKIKYETPGAALLSKKIIFHW